MLYRITALSYHVAGKAESFPNGLRKMALHASLRVCLVSPHVYPIFNPMARGVYGDAELFLHEMARIFGDEDDIEMNVLTGDFDQNEVEYYSGILVFRGNFNTGRTVWQRLVRKKSPLEALLNKIDAHMYFMSGANGLTRKIAEYCHARRRCFLFRISNQQDCDGTFVHGDPAGEDYRWALHRADMILCQTEEQKKMLLRTENLNAERVPNLFRPEPVTSEPRTDVLWLGEAVEWKQPELFFRLALTIPHQNFTILTRPHDSAYFERLVTKTRDVPNLGFENSVPYHEWPVYLRRAKLLINTSRFEGYPFSFTQAFSYGIPVASLNVDPDGILEKKQIGICAHGSEVRLAQAVADLIAYPRQWKRLSDNALLYARTEQSLPRTVEAYRRIFLQCVGTRKRSNGK